MDTNSPFLSVTAAARVLGMSRRCAYEMVRARRLPAVRVGGRIKVPAAALDRWIADRADEALASLRQDTAP